MAVRVGINGFGRIGRLVFRAAMEQGGCHVLAVNDITDAHTLAHLLRYDSVHGKYPGSVEPKDGAIVVDGAEIKVLSERDPPNLPWGDLGVDVVLESTGLFTEREKTSGHLKAGAKKVLVSAPAKDEDVTVVLGVNDSALKSEYTIVSNASCTTNCLAPMVKVLNDNFGVRKGLMTTIHSYTSDQGIVDQPHKDLRRARSAAVSMIPTTTGAAVAVGKVIPELNGKLNGMSVRVPTPNGSLTDFVAELKRSATEDEVNEAFKVASQGGSLRRYLFYSEEPIVLADIIGDPASCIFDAPSTCVVEDNLVKVIGWYDNEWGYANRCSELIKLMAD